MLKRSEHTDEHGPVCAAALQLEPLASFAQANEAIPGDDDVIEDFDVEDLAGLA